MPLDNPEQNGSQGDATLDWATAPDQFRAAHERAQARQAEIQAQLNAVTRENAARAAGIDISSPVGTLWINSYDGELTPEAMKTNFDALGIAPPAETPPPTVTDGPTQQELDEQRNRRLLHGEGTAPGQEPVGELWTGTVLPTFHESLAQGNRREVAFAQAVDKVFEAAMNPEHPQHNQAVWNRERWLAGQQ